MCSPGSVYVEGLKRRTIVQVIYTSILEKHGVKSGHTSIMDSLQISEYGWPWLLRTSTVAIMVAT